MDIRHGDASDIPALQALEQHARSVYAALPDFAFAASAPPISAERLAAGTTLIAELDDAPAGFALVQSLDGALYLANIAVAPRAARRSVGAGLLRRVIDEATRRQALAVTLTTFRAPPWNGPWFRKHGFIEMPDAAIGPGLRAVLDRHATFLDMARRETLWLQLGDQRAKVDCR